MRKRKEGGFTLIELMIVIAIIAIIAAIAIPSLLRSRIAANEVAAIGALRSLVTAQEELRLSDIIDRDADGAGEYGFFQELSGTLAPPGHAAPILPEFFDPVFGVIVAGSYASKNGYYFRITLPGSDPAGPEVAEGPGPGVARGAANDEINQQENRWVCYAWPMDYDSTGRRTFVVNNAGTVFSTNALATTYDSLAVIPSPQGNAAYAVGTDNLSGPLANGVGVDGNAWHPAD